MRTTPPSPEENETRNESAFLLRYLDPIFELRRGVVFAIVTALVVVIAAADKIIERNVSLGLLYTFPIVVAAMAFRRREMLLLVTLCSFLREHYGPYSWEPDVVYRLFYTLVSFAGLGFVLGEFARNRRLVLRHSAELRRETDRRHLVEAQLTALVESSPAGVIIAGTDGLVEMANAAAEQMFGVEAGELHGRPLRELVPVVADLAAAEIVHRGTTTCLGHRANGEGFHAYVWYSTLPTAKGNRMAAILVDSSEDLRDAQEASLTSILRSTRVLVGSVSHEIRNLAAAILMVHTNLGRIAGVSATEDYNALGTLAQGLSRLATVELSQAAEPDLGAVDMARLLEEFSIIVAPSLEAIDGKLVREVPHDVPLALGDHQGLIQVLMNLSRNSVRVMEECDERQLTLKVSYDEQHVYLRVIDTGPGLADATMAFQPFQPGANASGLGLFISRAIIRACHGELYNEPCERGCTMVAKLRVYPVDETAIDMNDTEVSA